MSNEGTWRTCGTWYARPINRGKLRPETCVSGSHRQSRTRAPGSRPVRERTWDLVSSARWGRGERRPIVKETHPTGSDWRRTLVLAPPLRPPIPRVQGPHFPSARQHPASSNLHDNATLAPPPSGPPRLPVGTSAHARFRARANGKPSCALGNVVQSLESSTEDVRDGQ